MSVLYHLAYPDASTRNDVFLIERFIAALNNREVQNQVRRRKPLTYAAALAAANEETSFVLMDLATHAPGRVQAPIPGDTSFIAALKARRPSPSTPGTSTTERRKCFYCDGEGHICDRCPYTIEGLPPPANPDGKPTTNSPYLKQDAPSLASVQPGQS